MKHNRKLVLAIFSATIFFSSCSNKIRSNEEQKHDTIHVESGIPENRPLWKELPRTMLSESDTLTIRFKNYRLFDLDSLQMQLLLARAKKENPYDKDSLRTIIPLPKPNGGFSAFSIYTTSVMAPELEAKYPQLKTYEGIGETNRTSFVRMDFNLNGFHAYVRSQEGEWIIQPVANANVHRILICFFKQDAVILNGKPFELPDSLRR
jgi:hypothetical protein